MPDPVSSDAQPLDREQAQRRAAEVRTVIREMLTPKPLKGRAASGAWLRGALEISTRDLLAYEAELQRVERERARLEAQLAVFDEKWYPQLAGTALGEKQLGHEQSAERWGALCRDFRALAASAETPEEPAA